MFTPAHIFELPVAISPSLAGIVGALAGACAFLSVLAVFMRKPTKIAMRDEMISLPPYSAPLDPTALPIAPSRGYAKMGFAFGERVEENPIDPLESLAPMVPGPQETEIFPKVKVAPVVVLSAPPAPLNRDPNPLGVIRGSSLALKPARIDELSFEDGPTTISEPAFEEPPQPRRMGSRPKIRAIAPSPPRFPAAVS